MDHGHIKKVQTKTSRNSAYSEYSEDETADREPKYISNQSFPHQKLE